MSPPVHAEAEVATQLEQQTQRVVHAFKQRYGQAPEWLAAAPGRVNLIGEHTDYNDGFVLPMAIDRYAVIAAGQASGDGFQAYSLDLHEARHFQADDPGGRKTGDWSNYLRGVVDGCRAAGLWAGPLNLVLESEVPVGGGLSSSAALEVAMATVLEAATQSRLEPTQKAFIAQRAEHDYAGVPCGIMDQFASALCEADHLMLLDCRSSEPTMVPFVDPDIAVLIINSNVRHALVEGEYAERRSQCARAAHLLGVAALRDADTARLDAARDQMDEVLFRRARHVIWENERTLQAAEAFSAGSWARAGELMWASHQSLRDDYEVSCPELDLLADFAMELGEAGGVFGSRMTGGGFGGCTVTLARRDAVDDIIAAISTVYRRKTGLEAAAFATRPARGAHILS